MASLIRRDRPVFIVDNCPDTLGLLRMEFQQHGFEVITAEDARIAIEAYKSVVGKKTPCVAILDAALGASGTGYKVARTIRDLDKADETLTIIYTAYDVADDPLGLHPEVDAVLRKPMGGGQLLGEILRVAELKERALKFRKEKDISPLRNPQNRLIIIGFAALIGTLIIGLLLGYHFQSVYNAQRQQEMIDLRRDEDRRFEDLRHGSERETDNRLAQMQRDMDKVISQQVREGLLIQDTRDALLAHGILKQQKGKIK